MRLITSILCKYTKIILKYYKLLTQRDNLINKACNELNLDDVDFIVIEDLKNVKKDKPLKKQQEKGKDKLKKKEQTDYNNKSQYWSYRQVIEKITRMCEVNGVEMVKVSPSYTSQTCSECGHVDENSRNKEIFSCTSCEKMLDADYNASINIRNRGERAKEHGYSPSNQELHYFS